MNPYDSTVDAMIFKIMCYAYMSFTIDPEDFKLQL